MWKSNWKVRVRERVWYTESGISDISVGKGELLCQPCNSDDRLQIVIEGTVNIYHIRDDGSKYFIAMNEGIYLLGDMEFMNPAPCIYFVEAVTPVTVAVLSLKNIAMY